MWTLWQYPEVPQHPGFLIKPKSHTKQLQFWPKGCQWTAFVEPQSHYDHNIEIYHQFFFVKNERTYKLLTWLHAQPQTLFLMISFHDMLFSPPYFICRWVVFALPRVSATPPFHFGGVHSVTSRLGHSRNDLRDDVVLSLLRSFASSSHSFEMTNDPNLASSKVHRGRRPYDREEPAVSYRWTGWVWKIIGWSSRLQENYRPF